MGLALVGRRHRWAIVVGGLIGAWQGFWVAYVGIPAFIVTLAGMLTFRGLTQMVLQNVPITPFPDPYVAIGSGFLPDLTGGRRRSRSLTLILGFAATIGLVAQEFRERAKRVKMGLEDEPRTLVPGQGRLHRRLHPGHHLRPGQLPRHPDRAGHPGGAGADLHAR